MLTYCSINTPTFQITHATRQQRVSETCGTFYYRLIIMEMFVFRVLPCDESCDKWWSKSSHCFLWKGSRPQNKYAVWAVTIWLVRCEHRHSRHTRGGNSNDSHPRQREELVKMINWKKKTKKNNIISTTHIPHCLGIKMIQFLFCVCLLQNVLYLNCLFDGPLI